MDAITLLVAALTTARLTRLVTTDRITEAPRNAILRRLDADSLWAYLIVCSWCVSVYVGAAVAGVLWAGPSWMIWPIYACAFSYVAGYLASREGE